MGGAAGSALGGKFGMATMGSQAGVALAKRISKAIGSGDYVVTEPVEANTLIKSTGNAYAKIKSSDSGTRISHREFLGDVFNSSVAGSFGITGYNVNPGLVATFPYLASIAQNFEEYRINGLVFEFMSTTSPYNTNSAMGSVIMAMEYNAAAPAYTNKPQMENSDFAISGRLDKNLMYGVECKDNVQMHYYTRNGNSVLPVTTTDLGVFYIATQCASSIAASANLGELWVSYDIEFFRPRISPARFGYMHLNTPFAAGNAIIPFPSVSSASALASSNGNVVYGSFYGVNVSATNTLSFPNAELGDTYVFIADAVAVTSITGNNFVSSTVGFSPVSIFPTSTGYSSNSQLNLNAGAHVCTTFSLTITDVSVPPRIVFASLTESGGGYFSLIAIDVGNGFNVATL